MELKPRGIPPTTAEAAAVESVLGAAPQRNLHDVRCGHAFRDRRHLLLPAELRPPHALDALDALDKQAEGVAT